MPSETFEDRVRQATGMTLADCVALGEEQVRLETERIRAAGYCCRAGYQTFPDDCPWHGSPWRGTR